MGSENEVKGNEVAASSESDNAAESPAPTIDQASTSNSAPAEGVATSVEGRTDGLTFQDVNALMATIKAQVQSKK
jgi:hypothetical protein